MSDGSTPCESCGHLNTRDAMFCSKCGAKMGAPSASASAVTPTPAPEPSEPPPAPAPSEPAPSAQQGSGPPRRIAGAARTMLGMPMSSGEAAAPPASAPAASEPQAPPRRAGGSDRPAAPSGGRTMLGMPAPQAAQIDAALAAAKAKTAARSDPNAAQVDDGPTLQDDEPGPQVTARALDPQTNRTMLGQPAPKGPTGIPQSESSRQRSTVRYPTDTGEEEAMKLPVAPRPSSKLPFVVLGLGIVVMLVGGGALAWAFLAGGSDLNASVTQGESGEVLEIEVPGAEEGTRVRFHGEEQPLEAGVARFALSADALSLGDNELVVDVISADGDVESHTVALHLEMRIRADLGPLANVPPALDVIVEAPSGSEVSLDGEPLELDAQGRGSRRYPIDGAEASAEGMVEHVVRYVVQPPEGETAQGELRTRIPLTTMQLDRPGTQVITDRDTVEVAGAVAPGTTVTVGGEEVEVQMGRFLHRHRIESLGEHTLEVVARAPRKAPNVVSISIRRVEDLAEEAAGFEYDEELTYARIAQNPATYRGQRVRFEGLVYNVDVTRGRSVLQILASDCPRGERCPLWITYPAATDAELRTRVVVLGTVAGEQQFRSQSGRIRTVPRVDATFVLPASSGGARRR